MRPFNRRQKTMLRYLETRIRGLDKKKDSRSKERMLGDCYRETVRLFQDVVSSHPSSVVDKRLRALAGRAMSRLGGQGDLSSVSLKNYDHRRYGPYLGVSDEGSVAHVIRKAALDSPKALAFKTNDPLIVGAAVDAERLGGIGEVAVGPEEYIQVRLECIGRLLNSTNVGTRVNLRFYHRPPLVTVPKGRFKDAFDQAMKDIRVKFEPFLRPPGGKPRPLTVFIEFEKGGWREDAGRMAMLKQLAHLSEKDGLTDGGAHRLGYKVWIGLGKKGRDAVLRALDVASAAGIKDVAVDGVVRKQSDENVSYPGLLNYLAPGLLGPILRRSNKLGIQVRPANPVDPETVARHIWSALHTARQMGFELGKYGLFPLTLEESDVVVRKIQAWFPDWTPAPVFFVDQGLLSATRVDTHGDLIRGLKTWLEMAARHKVSVVLIDTIEKAKKMSLLRLPGQPGGFMTPKKLAEIDLFAKRLGIKVLWAGGITLPQAFILGRLGVFGVYVTSAASSSVPVPPEYQDDPWLAAVKEPTFDGVFRTILLLEAGFLSVRLRKLKDAEEINRMAEDFLKALDSQDEAKLKEQQRILADALVGAWRRFRS